MDSPEASGEGSLNVLQDSNENHDNVTEPAAEPAAEPDRTNESFHSTQTTTESLPASSISMCSESNLLVPGKLFCDISKLKSCYSAILKEIFQSVKSTVKPDDHILLLTREQLEAGCKQGKMNAPSAKAHLINLLESVRPVCVPSYQEDTRPKRNPVDMQLHEMTKNIQALSSQNTSQFETLKTELGKCQATISNYENLLSQPSASSPSTPQLIDIPTDAPTPELEVPHVDQSVEDFLTEEECTRVTSELTDLPYTRERGRLTMKFGEYYSYNGSRGESTVEFPPCLKAILDKLNENHVGQDAPLLNSCVVNKYVGPTSFIASHSDDEKSIHPESSIFTVSVGKDATVHFRDIMKNTTHDHVASSGSMYCMSRKSQGCFKHQIDKDTSWTGSDVRISLTFRSVHWRNNNSTIVLGDSNTGGLKFASFEKNNPTHDFNGTFGNAMPGKREAAFVVSDIDAGKCVGYNNVVIHCGLNDVRQADIQSDDDVRNVYVKFKSKINQVLHVNKRARVYVNLLLPTKIEDCNKKIKYFNRLIIDDLCKSFDNRVKSIDAHKKFCDSNGFLSTSLSQEFNRENRPDYLHLNAAGLKLLSVSIKNAIFVSKRQRQGESTQRSGGSRGGSHASEQQAGETYAGTVDRPPFRGRRGGHNNRGRGRVRRS